MVWIHYHSVKRCTATIDKYKNVGFYRQLDIVPVANKEHVAKTGFPMMLEELELFRGSNHASYISKNN